MRTLSQCTECGRLVAADGGTCPFCDGPVAVAAPRPAAGRLSRAALLAGAAALGGVAAAGAVSAGCATQKEVRHQDGRGAADAGADQVLVVVTDAGTAQPPQDAGELLPPPDDDWRHHRRNCDNCPYGAPPLPLERVLA